MKLRYVAPLAIAACAAAIGLAPIAAADVNVQQSPGNAQITATPGAAAPPHGLSLVGVDYPPDAELEARAKITRDLRVVD